jgi:hypothetical protein
MIIVLYYQSVTPLHPSIRQKSPPDIQHTERNKQKRQRSQLQTTTVGWCLRHTNSLAFIGNFSAISVHLSLIIVVVTGDDTIVRRTSNFTI